MGQLRPGKLDLPVYERGGAMLEFALCLPVLLIMITGMVNMGSILYQVQVFSDAIDIGAKVASRYSFEENSCAALLAKAESETEEFISTFNVDPYDWWEDPVASKVEVTWDGVTECMVKVSISTKGTSNCVLCYDNLLDHIPITLQAVYSFYDKCDTCS